MSTLSHAAAPPARALTAGGVLVLSLGALDFGLEQSIIVPALPVLGRHYGASTVGIGWLATAFLLSAIAAVPLFGRLGDLLGKRRLLLASLCAFALGSLVCALADSIGVAIAGRAIQGLGAAVAPLTLGIARDTLPPELLPRAIGFVVGAASTGGAIGFLLSGLLVDEFSPTAVFWFLFWLAVALVVGVVALVRESPVRGSVRVDAGGALLVSAGLVALLLAISEGSRWGWWSGRIVGLFVAAAALLAAFAVVERLVRQPLVDLRLVSTRPFAEANVCAFAFGFAFFVAAFVIPQIAGAPEVSGYGLGLTTTQIGLVLAPAGLAALAAGWAGGRLVDRVGPRALVASGSLCGIASYVSLALAHDTAAALAAGSTVLGLAWGLILTGIYPVVIRGVGTDKSGVAPAVVLTMRNTGVSIGTQGAFAFITGAGLAGKFPAEAGFTRAFVMAAVGAAVALLASAFIPGRAPAGR